MSCVSTDPGQTGVCDHEKKSVLQPTQQIVFLGFNIDSQQMTVKVTGKNCKINNLKSSTKNTIRAVAGLIGLMIAYLPSTLYVAGHISKHLRSQKTRR